MQTRVNLMREKVDICRFFLAVTSVTEDVPLMEFMYLVFTCMPAESYHRRLRSLLLCYVV